jgi:CheY-like chemotaxis protein
MPDGGTLRFSARPSVGLPGPVRAELDDPSASDDSFVAIAVADDGAGMPSEVRERAFEPFFTTKEAGRGTGLGLSTVYGFAKQTKGGVSLESSPGAGSTLTLYLPSAWGADGPVEIEEFGETLPDGLRVLLVEDDSEVRKVAQTFLETLGCRVTSAASGEQALLALDPKASFDLLLSDIALGSGMRGTQLAAEAQLRRPALSVLLMSGYSAELLEADRDSPASWELLRKPFSRRELARAINRVLSARDDAG